MTVLDLGGYAWNWTTAPDHPKTVLVVNLDDQPATDMPSWAEQIKGDACALPTDVLERRFDLVYSNSLIEHVGGYFKRVAVAQAVQALGTHHWVQTPARSFPVEQHWVFPFFQFFPVIVRANISRRWPLSPPHLREATIEENVDNVLGVDLVSVAEMRRLFPQAEIFRERFLGLTKSIIAVA